MPAWWHARGRAPGRADKWCSNRRQPTATDGNRHDERLGVVDDDGLEGTAGTFDQGLRALDEVEHVDAAAGVVGHRLGEPVAARLNEFTHVQAGAFLASTVAAGHGLEAVDQIVLRRFGGALPLVVRKGVSEVNRTWFEAHGWDSWAGVVRLRHAMPGQASFVAGLETKHGREGDIVLESDSTKRRRF